MVRPAPRSPSLYQINTRVWLTEVSKNLGRRHVKSPAELGSSCRAPPSESFQE
jgi:hypothetical protein